jgi:nucleolar MIF4G domain-containing protein 1
MKTKNRKQQNTKLPFKLEKEIQSVAKDSKYNLSFKKNKLKKKRKLVKNRQPQVASVPVKTQRETKLSSKLDNPRVPKLPVKHKGSEVLETKKKRFLKNDELDREDEAIKKLEKKVKSKELEGDGLDYLLNYGEDFDEMDLGKESSGEEQSLDNMEGIIDSDDDLSIDMESDSNDLSEEIVESESDENTTELAAKDPNTKVMVQKTNSTNDIYGQKNLEPVQKYVPPHARPKDNKLKSILKGHMNKLTINNFRTILDLTLLLFRDNPRGILIQTITELVNEFIRESQVYCNVFAIFITCLYHCIGIEVGASVVQDVITKNLAGIVLANGDVPTNEQMESNDPLISLNFVSFFSYLYNYKCVSYKLIYDIIKTCILSLGKAEIETIAIILKNSGAMLRKDDPSSLKDIIVLLNSQLKSKNMDLQGRLKFVVESIQDLKNNRNVKIDADLQRHVKIMKHVLSSHGVLIKEPLGVTLQDIRDVDTKGKWWLVGSVWKVPEEVTRKKSAVSSDILALAKKHKMNTPVRQQIFITIMTSSDFLECHRALIQLRIPAKQQRNHLKILCYLALQSKVYNPFYGLVVREFCKENEHKITLRYTIWDYCREIENLDDTERGNLGKLVGWLISENSCGFDILKVLDFATGKEFLLQVLKFCLDQENYEKTFKKIVKLEEFGEKLVWFFRSLDQDEFDSDLRKRMQKVIKIFENFEESQ